MFKVHSISTRIGLDTYFAAYEIKDGEVCVMSALGSAAAPLGQDGAAIVAKKLLSDILHAARTPRSAEN
jgi:hypothetical protein